MTLVRERHVRIAGLRVHVREVGEGRPLLLVNGIGASTAWWATVEDRFAGMRLIEFDAPGTGVSQTPPLPAAIQALGWVAARVLDEVGVERADVLGYSLGGTIAQQLALSAPDRVRRLVLAATTCGWGGVPAPLPIVANAATPLRYWSKDLYHRTISDLAGGRARDDPAFLARHSARRFVQPPSTLGYMWQVLALGMWTSLPWLSRIRHPALVVTGDDDPLMPPVNAYILARRLPQGRLLVARGEGHLLLMDDESTVHQPIQAFLRAQELEQEPAWRDATIVDDDMLRTALRATKRSTQPLRAGGAVMRRAWPAPARA